MAINRLGDRQAQRRPAEYDRRRRWQTHRAL